MTAHGLSAPSRGASTSRRNASPAHDGEVSGVFASPAYDDHEEVVFCRDAEAGLKAIIAVHSTARGPALGGCRMRAYASEAGALEDVLRLSRAMTFKNAIADLPFGGGKSVIIGDSKRDKTRALFRAFGRFVERLGGRYLTAEDSGTGAREMAWVAAETVHVRGLVEGGSGDPSPATAYGVFCGIKAAVRYRLGRDDIRGVRVAVQGVGHVGLALCRLLKEAGAGLVAADVDADALGRAAAEIGVTPVEPDAIYAADADVFAPCALGGVLNGSTIPRLKSCIVAGAANNQLAREEDGAALRGRGILYAPDYVINAGGVINIANEAGGYDRERALSQTAGLYEVLMEVFTKADEEGVATNVMADRLASERIGGGDKPDPHGGRRNPV